MAQQYFLKPNPSDKRNVSQADIKNNFTYLQTSVGNDHNFTNDPVAANDGLHKQSTYFVSPDPTTTATQMAVYVKNDANAKPQIWYRPISNGTPVQVTATPSAGTVPTIGANGATYLPGGVLFQWGTGTSGVAVTFPVAYSATFTPRVTVTPTSTTVTTPPAFQAGPTATGVTIGNNGGQNFTFHWMAIGPA